MKSTYDVTVVGGGPAGATAAHELARAGHDVLLLDRAGRVKPCGGAVPPQLLDDFDVPDSMLVNRVDTARIIGPDGELVDIPVEGGFVGMVDRGPFDEWLRTRAELAGADRRVGSYLRLQRRDGWTHVRFADGDTRNAPETSVRTRFVIGADGALSSVARQEIPGAEAARYVFAYHEIVRSPSGVPRFGAQRCDVYYDADLSPDFYAWVFPHGETTSVGMGTQVKGFGMREAVDRVRGIAGLERVETLKAEGAPIPLRVLPRWDNGRDVILAGDAAGVVAPASGEGIFYAMTGGRLAARSVSEALASGRPAALRRARRRFLRAHGSVFFVLGVMQRFWYTSDRRRRGFVAICRDRDVQRLTFEGYMRKRLVRARPAAHARIFLKNIGHLTGVLRGGLGPSGAGFDRDEVDRLQRADRRSSEEAA